jgi:glycosyltransferase involved in cell wall biosynthesis
MKDAVALLGRPDIPADGVADYCAFLGAALGARGLSLNSVHLPWADTGWISALRQLVRESRLWRGKWVLIQYTALAWSRRGFPLGVVIGALILRLRGARCGMVFHEPSAVPGSGAIGRMRSKFQNWVIRSLHRLAERSVFTIPLNDVRWLPAGDQKSSFIPLGPNIPEDLTDRSASRSEPGSTKTVVVFCVSELPHGEQEIKDAAAALRVAAEQVPKLRAVFVGRGTEAAQSIIVRAFDGTPIEVCNRGLCAAQEVTRIFSEADAMLAVRGRFYLRRGSALAGLACGLPLVAYAGAAEDAIVKEAGILLVPFRDQTALGLALQNILTDSELWRELHRKNIRFQRKYLSWDVIADSYIGILEPR